MQNASWNWSWLGKLMVACLKGHNKQDQHRVQYKQEAIECKQKLLYGQKKLLYLLGPTKKKSPLLMKIRQKKSSDKSVARENNHGATHKTNHKFDTLTISDMEAWLSTKPSNKIP